MWWLISIYNTLIVVWKFPLETDRARRKLTFFIQFVLSIVLPSALVTTSLKVGGAYSSTSVFTIMCSPPTLPLMFHTFILPGSVIILIGTVMSAFIIYRLHKVRNSYMIINVYQSDFLRCRPKYFTVASGRISKRCLCIRPIS